MRRNFFILLGILLAVVFWVTEGVIHCSIFHEGDLGNCMIPTALNEIWMRGFIVFLFVVFGVIVQRLDNSRVEAEVRRGEEQFKAMMDASPEAIVVYQGDRWVYANDAAVSLFGGAGAGDIIGRTGHTFVQSDNHEIFREWIRQLTEGKSKTPHLEERLLRLDGVSFMAEVHAVRVDYDGYSAAMIFVHDIDERKRWEEDLKASVKHAEVARDEAQAARIREQEQSGLLEMFYRHTHDCIALLDRDFNFIRVNEAYAKEYEGRDPAEFPGHNHFEFYPSSLIEDFRRVVDTGFPFEVCDYPFTFPDHPEWGETYWDLSLIPIADADGRVKFLLLTLKDVTERRRALLQLRQSESRLKEAQQLAHMGSWELDLVENRLWWSDENYRIFGVEPGTGNTYEAFLETVHPDDRTYVDRQYTDSVNNREPYSIEHRLRLKDGMEKWVHERCETYYDEDGSPVRSVGTTMDITESKRAQEALVASKVLLQSVIENAPIRVFWKDSESRFLGCNTFFAKDAGMARAEELIGKSDFDMTWRDQAELYRADDQQVMASGIAKLGYEEPQTSPEGKTIWLRTSKVPLRNAAGEVFGLLGIYDDITKRKESEINLLQANRALRTISACNSVLVHASDEAELLNEMCRIIVKTGGYRMAWVGVPENDAGKSVRPIAQAGFVEGYLESARITWDGSELGKGPTGSAIRTGKTAINQDCLSNPKMAPWRESAIRHGYRSSIALPLVFNGRLLAVLAIYAAEAEAFNFDEVVLLEELANDLAYGIGSVRARVAHAMAEERLDFMAHHDALTGLPNRILLHDRFEQAVAMSTRNHSCVAILLLDIDHFQQVNDSLGHGVGDGLLLVVVERLHACIRESDTISRMGGDEFTVLLAGVADPAAIELIAQEIIDVYTEPFHVEGHTLTVTVSIGISIYPNDGVEFDKLFRQADAALYLAKDDGRDTYHFFTEQMNEDAVEHLQLQGQLRKAIENHEFKIFYQPQIDALSGEIIGVEALLRWQHPQLGMISPAKFIPLAERSGLIIPLGEWAIHEACRQGQTWREGATMPPLVIAVNLSAIQFRRGNIVETVAQALARSGFPADCLELELTESILLHDIDTVVDTLHRLKKIDVKLSIDDFGTGYSSLSYLKRLAVDKLKIDQSFVRDMVEDPEDAAIVKAIVQLGHTLQLDVIAEGVENGAQLQLLKDFGCNEVQGYLFSHPIPAEDFARLYGKGGAKAGA